MSKCFKSTEEIAAKKRQRAIRQRATFAFTATLTIYLLVAILVFRFRHPWMTGTETLIAAPQILTFGTCVYSEWRPR